MAFPQSWAADTSDEELVERLASKAVTPDRAIVVYGYDDGDSSSFAERLVALGYSDVATVDGGQSEWAARDDLDVVRLPRFRQLVPPQWLRRLGEGHDVDEGPDGPLAVFHVGHGSRRQYESGHIPGAFYLDTAALESPADWNRRSPGELESALLELGVTLSATVILYGRDVDAESTEPGHVAGQIAATRAAAILLYAGVEDVRILDGGFGAWLAAGYPVETTTRVPAPASDLGMSIPAHPGYFIDFDEAGDLIADPDGVLVSVRSRAEHFGTTSGYDYIQPQGDIPGAVWANGGTDANDMRHYRNIDNTMRDFDEIAANWETLGITPDKNVAFYCGTGWRASEAFFSAYLMGWPNVSMYDGGWFEWSRRVGESG